MLLPIVPAQAQEFESEERRHCYPRQAFVYLHILRYLQLALLSCGLASKVRTACPTAEMLCELKISRAQFTLLSSTSRPSFAYFYR